MLIWGELGVVLVILLLGEDGLKDYGPLEKLICILGLLLGGKWWGFEGFLGE